MAKLMSKSELIQKIAQQHPNSMTRKDVKSVIESLAEIGTKNSRKRGLLRPRIRQIRCHQEARHKGEERHQSLHKGTDDIQSEARSEDHQGTPGEGCQGRGVVASKTSMGHDGQCGAVRHASMPG